MAEVFRDRGGGPLVADSLLNIEACPWCRTVSPLIDRHHSAFTAASPLGGSRTWTFYACRTCSGGLLVESVASNYVTLILPAPKRVSDTLPERARHFLREAINTVASPSASITSSASAVDGMLKAKGLKIGSLYSRIDEAVKAHVLTEEMGRWAHQVRLDANEQRHADEDVPLPAKEDAERALDFTEALGEYLFVLPARVTKGVTAAAPKKAS